MQIKTPKKNNNQDWEVKKLGEVCDIKTGKRDANHGNPDGKYHFFTCAEKHSYIDDYSFDCEAILVAGNGDVGASKYFHGKFDAYQRTYVLHNFRDNINPLLLYKYLNGFLKGVVSEQKLGGTMPYIKLGMLQDFEISYPKSLTEQKRIVKILDEAFENIEKAREIAEKNLRNIKELFESYLQSIDNEKKPLGSLVDIKTGKLDSNAAEDDGEYPFFTCAKEVYNINNYAFDCEAILLAGNNAVGDFNVKHYSGKFNAYQRTYVITVNEDNNILYRYLYYQLVNSLKEFKQKSVGTGTKFLKLGIIKSLEIDAPPIKTQKQIVKKLDALSEKVYEGEAIFQRKIALLDELKKSVLKKAFSGEL